ncbi:MAG: T9SS type A sorting domain-containing protein [Prevotella sp.]|nr:T9SS type A sorting domain-containing protein [Prevotella sp.]
MNKKLFLLFMPLLLCGVLPVLAQSGCNLYIESDFDSECLLTEYIRDYPYPNELDLGDCILACKGNTVTYTAVGPNDAQYSWTVIGAASYYPSNQNRTMVVTWGNEQLGSISVNMVTANSNTCTAELCLVLIDPPQIASATVPAYYIDQQGRKVIEVCLNETVELMDLSIAGETPIVGYRWETPFGDASTPNHTIVANQTGKYTIEHYVQNECGCEDYEEITISVLKSEEIEISCYGTVCAGSEATYTLLRPNCNPYNWSVDGGSYISDPATPATIQVQWGNPPSGYGIISFDAAFCDLHCPAFTSIKIPVITDGAAIAGPDVVCVGDLQQYELPVWGSTHYSWSVLQGNVTMTNTEEPNQVLVRFPQTGTYTLHADYGCDFIDCGPFSTSKTIEVKDTMSVNSADHTLCKGATGTYTTWHGNSVTWRVYDQSGAQIYQTDAISLSFVFATAGNYRIVASGSNYCADAEYLVKVLDNPPALNSTNGPHEACPRTSILLSGTPTHPNFYLEWAPACTTATPSLAEGDEVTISYAIEICNVAVYQVDNENGCRSEAYIHTVQPFTLAPSGFPPSLTKCAGETFVQSVPLQDNVLYEWTISPAGVASIQGDHLSNSVSILVNHLVGNQPATATVTLKRTDCTGVPDVESFKLYTLDAPDPTISYTTPVCPGDNDYFSVNSPAGNPSQYTWHIDGNSIAGTSTSYMFTQSGTHPFTLDYQPFTVCPAIVVTGAVEVVAPPKVVPYLDGQNLYVIAYPNASYHWEIVGDPTVWSTTNYCPYTVTSASYCCTVTYNNAPYCSATGCFTNQVIPGSDCNTMSVSSSPLSCTSVSVTASPPGNGIASWSVVPSLAGNSITPNGNTVVLDFIYPGVYTVIAEATDNGQCYRKETQAVIECVPDFALTYSCNNPVAFEDKTLCRIMGSIVSREIEVLETGYTNSSFSGNTIPLSAFLLGSTNHVTYTVTLSNGLECQVTKAITIDALPTIGNLNVSPTMCRETPYLFSAMANGTYKWVFGDGSYIYGNNVYHAFTNNATVTLYVTNSDGCTTSLATNVNIVNNPLNNISLSITGPIVCPGISKTITANPYSSYNTYYWEHSATGTQSNTYNTYQTGDYHVLVTDNVGCKKEAMTNVPFLNAPTAKITGKTEYCIGERVKLYGNTGVNNQYTWTITGPMNDIKYTPNITFVPTIPGTYSVSLTVTSVPDGCSDVTTTTVIVHSQPAAPPISFNGDVCIHTPPVIVQSNSGQSLFWSNGFHGTSAEYYTPGFLSAHYLDPITGCPSGNNKLFIPPAPNYGALLTGCYEKCEDELPATLPVYGLYPYYVYEEAVDSIRWNWYEGINPILSGTNISPSLPVNNFTSYYLSTQYSNGCIAQSPTLNISSKDTCSCDSIRVTVRKDCEKEGCRLVYHLAVTICNGSTTRTAYFNQLTCNPGSNILSVNTLPVTVLPGGCQTIYVDLAFQNFASSYVAFTLYDPENDCEVSFSEYFDWTDCVDDDCKMLLDDMAFLKELSSPHQTSCFDVQLDFPLGITDLVALWSDPPQILSYTYTPYTSVDALLMLSYGQLTQLAANHENICIHAILCIEDDYLCHAEICIPATTLLNLIPTNFRQLPDNTTADTDSTRSMRSGTILPQENKPYLAPNPARDEVAVMGVAPEEVAEITILTMQGRQVASFRNDHRFNVSSIAKAGYIVRVVTTEGKVHYLKLVRQ